MVESRTDPRVVRTRRSVLAAALAELAERGYGAFTIDGVATRAGVARSTIYRQWPDRTALIADAIDELNRQPPQRADTDESPRERIVELVRHLSDAMRNSPVAACFPALVEAAEREPELRKLHHRYGAQRRAALTRAIAAAVEAGDVAGEVDPELASVAIAGAVMYRRYMTPRPLGRSEVEGLVSTVLGS